MSGLSESKCRYLAELRVFQDFEQEITTNSQFINFMSSTFTTTSSAISKEVQNRAVEKEHMKSPLARQIREELINFVLTLNNDTIAAIKSLFQNAGKQLVLLKQRANNIINNDKQYLRNSESYYQFYQEKLNSSMEKMLEIETSIKDLTREQIIKTKELEVRGNVLGEAEVSKYQSKRDVLGMQIQHLERLNKRFRSDLQIQTERLTHSYQHLTNSLVKQLKKSQNRMVDVITILLQKVGSSLVQRPKDQNSLVEEIHLQSRQCASPRGPVLFQQTKGTDQDNLYFPTFPGKESKKVVNELDSLFLSKSIDE